jgi:hypothetical protein
VDAYARKLKADLKNNQSVENRRMMNLMMMAMMMSNQTYVFQRPKFVVKEEENNVMPSEWTARKVMEKLKIKEREDDDGFDVRRFAPHRNTTASRPTLAHLGSPTASPRKVASQARGFKEMAMEKGIKYPEPGPDEPHPDDRGKLLLASYPA